MTDTTELRRLREYADLMPKAGWGWVTPGPGRRPIRLEAEGEVLARGIDEMAVAEYLGLVSPVSVLALLDELEQLRRVRDAAEAASRLLDGMDAQTYNGYGQPPDHYVKVTTEAWREYAHSAVVALRAALTADPREARDEGRAPAGASPELSRAEGGQG